MPNFVFSRRRLMTSLASAAVLAATTRAAFAKSINRFSLEGGTGFALKGYDTTAYFKTNAAVDGTDGNTMTWKGAIWRFVTPQDAALFEANPEAYAPQFGGYCTRAMSLGKEVPGDPEVWRIHNGKLYVFYAKVGGRHFDKGADAMIELAQKHWETLSFTQ